MTPDNENIERRVVIGNHLLIQGDSLKILPCLDRVDAVITDPPYGIGESGGKFRDRKGGNHRVLPKKHWDKGIPSKAHFDVMLSKSALSIIWGGNYFADFLPPSKSWLYWNKLMGGDFSDGELAWTNLGMPLRSFTKCNKGAGKVHPAQKPVELMEWCLSLLPNPPHTILDPFMGSGTTGIACQKLGYKFIGIESDQDYFDMAVHRITEQYNQPDMFIKHAVTTSIQDELNV